MPQTTASTAIVVAPEKIRVGPKMAKLTENQQNFVWALVQTGGQNPNRAATLAGFGGSDNARRVAVFRLMHNDDVIEAINEVASQRMRFAGLLAAEALLEVVGDKGHKDRVKAIGMALEHAGHVVVRKQEITVTKPEPSLLETVTRVRHLAQQLNMDPRELLLQAGVDPDIIDAEFEEVKPALPAPEPSTEGLEDLL